jgi:hypothetical protein
MKKACFVFLGFGGWYGAVMSAKYCVFGPLDLHKLDL